jgi:hypothetical protein
MMRKERRWKPKFDDNLYEFFTEMTNRGYEVVWMTLCYDYDMNEEEKKELYSDIDEVTYQSQNYEGCNVTLVNRETKSKQTVAVDYTGDDYCDVVPIVDWSFQRDKVDVVDEVITMLREKFLGDEA